MVSKVIFSVLVVLLVAQLTLADVDSPIACPNVETAFKGSNSVSEQNLPSNSIKSGKTLILKEEVHVEASLFGRSSKSLSVPSNGKVPTCILIFKIADGGNVAMVNIGISGVGGATVNLVSDLKEGIDAVVELYTD